LSSDCPAIVQQDYEKFNFLIEGDNLHSLKLLEKTHRNKIDVIYIDPPYNTGNKDFIYDDCYIDKNDGYTHSKWLSFMSKRLEIARNLLSKTGVIFISIDENEFAQLKLLCDLIFGENNFIGTMIWRKKSGGGQTDEFFVTEHEYIFGYRKSTQFIWNDKHDKIDQNEYKYKSSDGSLYKITKLEKWGSSSHKEDRPTMYFPIKDPDGNNLYPIAPDKKDGRWRVGKERLHNLIKNNHIHWIKDKKENRWIPYEMSFYNENQIKILKSRSILYDLAETGTATKLLTKIFNEKDIFSNPKPIELIKYLLEHTKCEIVLDFFAGSGTTGHAVTQLNKEDGRNRQYILCTNNENNICEEVTYQRLKNIQADLPHNLKYFKTDFIKKLDENDRTLKAQLMDYIKELIELEYMCEIDGVHNILVKNESELDAVLDENLPIKARLFIAPYVLLSRAQNALVAKKQATLIEIPEYYFRHELIEAGEL
jgi:Adenine specific DNA methylase Mod